MEKPISFYLNLIETENLLLKELKGKRNLLAIAKLLLFIVIVIAIIFLVDNSNTLTIFCLIGSIGIFLFTAAFDTKVNLQYKLQQKLINNIQTEIDYLNLDFSKLLTGEEFKDAKHRYSNDLDLFGKDSLFQFINRTTTQLGKFKLANWLRGTQYNKQEIKARQEAVNELSNAAKWRLQFKSIGDLNEEKATTSRIEEWLKVDKLFPKRLKIPLYLLVAVNTTIFIGTIFFDLNPNYPLYSSAVLLFIVFRFVKKTNKAHLKLDSFTKSFQNSHQLLLLINTQPMQSKYLKKLQENLLNGEQNALVAFKEVSKILGAFDQRSNILVTIALNAIYMRDLFLLIRLDNWKNKYNPFLKQWLDAIAEIDALSSLANYRYNNPEFIFPEIDEQTIITAKGLGHPSIVREVRVCNDFELKNLHELDIVTGANMAGKSTFLRTVGVNLVLAKCGGPVCANEFKFKPIHLFTSMRTTDDLADETSYFHAELLRLKQLTELAEKGEEVFIILDEILKGTNSTDKLNGSKRFLTRLLDLPVSGIVATHDLELGKLADKHPTNFKNVCFEISIHGSDITYDYKLKSGVSQNMNATLLMEGMKLI